MAATSPIGCFRWPWSSFDTTQTGTPTHVRFPHAAVCVFSSEDEISLSKGMWVNVLQKKSDGWWFVQFEKQRGWFPSNYLIEVKVASRLTFSSPSVRA